MVQRHQLLITALRCSNMFSTGCNSTNLLLESCNQNIVNFLLPSAALLTMLTVSCVSGYCTAGAARIAC